MRSNRTLIRAVAAALVFASLSTSAHAGPAEFQIRQTRGGRNIAIWQGDRAPTVAELRAILLSTPAPGEAHAVSETTHTDSRVNIAPAPQVDAIVLDSLGDMRFDFGSSALTPDTRQQLQSVCAAFSDDPELRRVKFHLIGHTCSIGTDAANDALSQRRASAAAAFLRGCLAGTNRVLATEARGETDHLANVPTDSPLQRRVEIAIVRPRG